jgi:hypothetical protein
MGDSLDLLLDYCEGLLDYSQTLISYIGSHWAHTEDGRCDTPCILRRLLKNGASPDPRDYHITPLQIVVVSWDYAAVKILLEAGAEPNATGYSRGIIWPENHILARFNDLHGKSPLYIFRYIGCIFEKDIQIEKGLQEEKIQDILLRYGAEERYIIDLPNLPPRP